MVNIKRMPQVQLRLPFFSGAREASFGAVRRPWPTAARAGTRVCAFAPCPRQAADRVQEVAEKEGAPADPPGPAPFQRPEDIYSQAVARVLVGHRCRRHVGAKTLRGGRARLCQPC